MWAIPGDIPSSANTRLVFGDGVPDVYVPTQMFGIFTAVVYLIGARSPSRLRPDADQECTADLLRHLIIPVALILARGKATSM